MSEIYEDWESLEHLEKGDTVKVGDKLVVASADDYGFDKPGSIVIVTSVDGDQFWLDDENPEIDEPWEVYHPFARLPDNRTIRYHFFENSVFAECSDATVWVINNGQEEFVWNKLPPVPME